VGTVPCVVHHVKGAFDSSKELPMIGARRHPRGTALKGKRGAVFPAKRRSITVSMLRPIRIVNSWVIRRRACCGTPPVRTRVNR
jgi:hypothetical protein